MWIEVIEVIDPRVILIGILILSILLVFLLRKIKRDKIIKEIELQKINTPLQEEIDIKLPLKPSEKDILQQTSYLAKEFLFRYYGIERSEDYSEIKKREIISSNPILLRFCNEMIQALYSGKQISREKMREILDLLDKIIKSQVSPEEGLNYYENDITRLNDSVTSKNKPKDSNYGNKETFEEEIKIEEPLKEKPKINEVASITRELPQNKEKKVFKQEPRKEKPIIKEIKQSKNKPKENYTENKIEEIDDIRELKAKIKQMSKDLSI